MSTKGQVILSKAIQDAKNWAPGARPVAESVAEGVIIRPERLFPAIAFEEVRGCLSGMGKSMCPDEIDTALKAAAKRRHVRG